MSQLSRVRFIDHRGRSVLFVDFSGLRDRNAAIATIDDVRAVVATQPPHSLLTLISVAGAAFDPEILQALQELARHNKPFVKAAALVGLSGLQRLAYAAVLLFSGREMPAFRDINDAKDWLVARWAARRESPTNE